MWCSSDEGEPLTSTGLSVGQSGSSGFRQESMTEGSGSLAEASLPSSTLQAGGGDSASTAVANTLARRTSFTARARNAISAPSDVRAAAFRARAQRRCTRCNVVLQKKTILTNLDRILLYSKK